MTEILPPGAPVPEAVRVPAVVRTWASAERKTAFMQLRDGGVWSIDAHAIQNLRHGTSQLPMNELFAQRPDLFRFVRRHNP